MSGVTEFSRSQVRLLDSLVETYEKHRAQISLFRDQLLLALTNSSELASLIHSIRSRLKDPNHLRDKLQRKMRKCKVERRPFTVRPENLLVEVNDLAGVRILHLYTRQIRQIDTLIREILQENKYELIEGPSARTWDDESRRFFEACGIATQESQSMYTSVHYVIGSASKTKVTAEIQVRTLMEEVWGEVDHTLNYPSPNDSLAVTSSASRLVDSIFATVEDHERITAPATARATSRRRPRGRPAKNR
jgi:putative GTP pyrophosphokinase